MKIAVIIAEYNPFHNGHAYHIAQTRAAGATHIAVVMSGNFVQRGEPAFLEKHRRAEMALTSGADLVLELPLPYTCAPAQRFAEGGVTMAAALGADMLSFGSECGSTALLEKTAASLETEAYRLRFREELDGGRTYAAAAARAMMDVWPQGEEVMQGANDILGLEYIRAIRRLGSSIKPLAIRRMSTPHDGAVPEGSFASASLLRSWRKEAAIEPYVPEECRSLLRRALAAGETPDPARYETAALAVLRRLGREAFSSLPDLSEGIDNRLYEASRMAVSLPELLTQAKTKRYTLSRIRRLVTAAFLGITAEDAAGLVPYLRVLGANRRGREILAAAQGRSALPVETSLAKLRRLGGRAGRLAELEGRASDLYALLLEMPRPCGSDFTETAIWTEK